MFLKCVPQCRHDLDYAPTKSGAAWINKKLLRKKKKKYHVCLNLSMPLTFNLGHTHNNKKRIKRHVPVRLKKERNQATLETGGGGDGTTKTAISLLCAEMYQLFPLKTNSSY